MSYTLTLPDDLYRALERYAKQQRQTPEEALATLVETVCATNGTAAADAAPENQANSNGSAAVAEYLDPWEGFRGKYTADVSDLTLNHDKYLAEAYLETHDDDE